MYRALVPRRPLARVSSVACLSRWAPYTGTTIPAGTAPKRFNWPQGSSGLTHRAAPALWLTKVAAYLGLFKAGGKRIDALGATVERLYGGLGAETDRPAVRVIAVLGLGQALVGVG